MQHSASISAAKVAPQRIDELFASARECGSHVFSFEIFPPRGDLPLEQAKELAARLACDSPDFISVTFSAGGSGSHERAVDLTASIAQHIQEGLGVSSVAHLTCVGTTRSRVDGICEDFKARGISNVLALRGDIPEGGSVGDFKLAHELIAYLKEKGFCVGAAAYPEGHVDVLDSKKNIEHLKAKYDAGADFFCTQLCFDNDLLYRFKEDALSAGIDAPINCGIMPFFSRAQLERMVFMCGVSLPGSIVKLIAKYESDEKSLRRAGIEHASEQILDLVTHGVDGVHVYTMNHPDVASTVRAKLENAAL